MDRGASKKDAKPQTAIKPNPAAEKKAPDQSPGETGTDLKSSGSATVKGGSKTVISNGGKNPIKTLQSVKGSEERDSDTTNESADPSITLSPGSSRLKSIDSAIKKVLQLSAKGEWNAVEQAMKLLDPAVVGKSASDQWIPLAGLQDEATGFTPLMHAVKDNRQVIMERMMDLGCDPHQSNKDGFNTFHLSVLHSREDIVRFLLSRKIDLSLTAGEHKQNVLHLVAGRTAAASGVAVAKLLLASGGKDYRLVKDQQGYLPLHVAIENGNVLVARELLAQSAEAQIKSAFGSRADTAFHAAARKRDVDLLRLLAENGAQVDARNAEGQTALHIAASEGDENVVKYLHILHANPNINDNEDRTPVLLAAEKGKTSVVELLTEKFRASCLERTKDGSTLLHVASLHGHPDTALMLLRKGVPLHMPNKSGARSIHIAARRGHVGVVQTLLQKGEQVDAATNDNHTALHIAVKAGKANVVETLLGHGAQVHIRAGKLEETPLHIAASVLEGGEKCAQMLLKSGSDPNLRRSDGDTPLHVAASTGHVDIVRLLLADEADPLRQNQNGETPLHLACRCSHLSVCLMLRDHVSGRAGAEAAEKYVNTANSNGETALHTVCSRKSMGKASQVDRDIVQALLQSGGDVGLDTYNTRETPLHYSAASGNVTVLGVLLASIRPTDLQRIVNKQNSLGRAPLLVAAKNGHVGGVVQLLQNQARVDIFDSDGMSGLHLAAESGHNIVCDALLAHKAFVNSKSRVGLTPLHLAALKGYTDLVRSLVSTHHATIDSLTLRKETPLQLAAGCGQLDVCSLLIELGADLEATDELGQKAIHLAAQQNNSEVIELFLRHQPALVSTANKDGNTCAHIAAVQGSTSVLQQLMKFDLQVVTGLRNRTSDATPLHLAAEGGHAQVAKMLLENGASSQDENKVGFTAIQLAAKNGHNGVIDVLSNASGDELRYASKRTGLTALHVAAFYGQPETVREILAHVPAGVRSEIPATGSSVLRELDGEAGLTPLHLAAYSGDENVVRLLLNSPGVSVDQPSAQNGFTSLHLACRGGHTAVAGLLLSRSTGLLVTPDRHGRSPLHVAAAHGHDRLAELLLGQGADINGEDRSGWTALHLAARAGHLRMVQLLLDSGASARSRNCHGRVPLWYAAAEGQQEVLALLLSKEHDAYSLMEDRRFVCSLMLCGKVNNNFPLTEFILQSPAPVDVAAKLSHNLSTMAVKEKERSKDLADAAKHCESMATELLALACSVEGAARLLTATDRRQMPLLDVLVEQEQKEVIAHPSVQRYLQDVWIGGLQWAPWKLVLLFFCSVLLPPVWLALCLPLGHDYHKIPVIRFMANLTSHVYLMILLILSATLPICPVLRTTLFPCWYEWLLLAWLSGNLLSELATPRDRGGLGWLRLIVLVISAIAILIHACAFLLPKSYWPVSLFARNQLLAVSLLLCCILLLEFLSFHYLFGPWAIIIGNLMVDAGRFLIILAIFMFGFSMHVATLNQPFYPRNITAITTKTITPGLPSGVVVTPLDTFEMLFFALFGLTHPSDLRIETAQPEWTLFLYKIVYGFYMLVSSIVLINMLIAMMSDTYQRIQAQSDIEWKFGMAKLVKAMHRTAATPSPLNLFTSWISYLYQLSRKDDRPGEVDDRSRLVRSMSLAVTDDKGKSWLKKFQNTGRVGPRDSNALGVTKPVSSNASMVGDRRTIEHVTDWRLIVKRYTTLTNLAN